MIDRRQFVTTAIAANAWLWGSRIWSKQPSLADLDLAEVSARVRQGSVSPVELTQACLNRIEARNPALNAFVTVTAEQALAAARECERELARNQYRGPLHGIPIALKDNIDTAGIRTTAATAALADRVPATDAEAVRRLKAAGAIMLGKLNMDECAYGVSTTTGIFGATQNPWQAGYSAGGSSGGPAAAVAAGLCYGALGTDTGGSIRQPAAWCSVVGLKPTYGLVSTRGVIPLSWSLDHVGPIARSTTDAAILLQAIAGHDPKDPSSIALPPVDYPGAMKTSVTGLRLGQPARGYFEQLDPEVDAAISAALDLLAGITAGMTTVELPQTPATTVMFVEAAAYYGPLLRKFPNGFSPAVRTLLNIGGKISGATYARDLRKLRMLRRDIREVFANVDLLVTPTTPDLPMTIDEARQPAKTAGPPLTARNTMPFNLFGLPTISVPCGFSSSGLPIGLQISGPPGGEARVLALAAAWEQHANL